jgi:hypothetical protein
MAESEDVMENDEIELNDYALLDEKVMCGLLGLKTDRCLKIMKRIIYERVSMPLVDNAWLITVE